MGVLHDDVLWINDIELSIPPTEINITKRSVNWRWNTLRTRNTQKAKSGRAELHVDFVLPFVGRNKINQELRKLIAQIRISPFCFIKNNYIQENIFPDNDRHKDKNVAVTIRQLTLEISAEAPNTVFAHFHCMYFNYFPYSRDFLFKNVFPPDGNTVEAVEPRFSKVWQQFYEGTINEYHPALIPEKSLDETSILWNEYVVAPNEKTLEEFQIKANDRARILDLVLREDLRGQFIDRLEGIFSQHNLDPDVILGPLQGTGAPIGSTIESELETPNVRIFNLPGEDAIRQVIEAVDISTLGTSTGIINQALAGTYQSLVSDENISIPTPSIDNAMDMMSSLSKDDDSIRLLKELIFATKKGKSGEVAKAEGQIREFLKSIKKTEENFSKRVEAVGTLTEIPRAKIIAPDIPDASYSIFSKKNTLDFNKDIHVLSMQIEFSNTIATIPIVGHVYPTHQHIGSYDAIVHMNMKVTSDEALRTIQSAYENIERTARDVRFIPQKSAGIKVANNLLQMCGLTEFLTEGIQVRAHHSQPGTYDVALSLSETSVPEVEDIKQEFIVTDNEARSQIIEILQQYITITSPPGNQSELTWVFAEPSIGPEHPLSKYVYLFLDSVYDSISLLGKLGNKVESARVSIFNLPRYVEIQKGLKINIDSNGFGEVFKNKPLRDAMENLSNNELLGADFIFNVVEEFSEAARKNSIDTIGIEDLTDDRDVANVTKLLRYQDALRLKESLNNELTDFEKDILNIDAREAYKAIGFDFDDTRVNGVKLSEEELIKLADNPVDIPQVMVKRLFSEMQDNLIDLADAIIASGALLYVDEFKNVDIDRKTLSGTAVYKDVPQLSTFLTFEDISSDSKLAERSPLSEEGNIFLDPDFYYFNEVIDSDLIQDFSNEFTVAKDGYKNLLNTFRSEVTDYYVNTYRQKFMDKDTKNVMDNRLNFLKDKDKKHTLALADNSLLMPLDTDTSLGVTVNSLNSLEMQGVTLQSLTENPSTKFEDSKREIATDQQINKTIITVKNKNIIRYTGDIFDDVQGISSFKDIQKPGFQKPLRMTAPVTSHYGSRIIEGENDFHNGIDWGAPRGTAVYPTAPGKIVRARWDESSISRNDNTNAIEKRLNKGGGFIVEIEHDRGIYSRYLHLEPNFYAAERRGSILDEGGSIEPTSSRPMPKAGERVEIDTVIGYVGNTGHSVASHGGTGSHLHFEVRKGHVKGKSYPPLDFIDKQEFTKIPEGLDTLELTDTAQGRSLFSMSATQLKREMEMHQGLRLNRAWPGFKLYFIEPDQFERNYAFDDFFNYSAVKSIEVLRHRDVPADLCRIHLTNISGNLSNRAWVNTGIDPEDIGRDVSTQADVRQPDTNKTNDNIYNSSVNNTINENPIASMMLKTGTQIQLRLGYHNDPNLLTTVFNGVITEVKFAQNDDLIEIVCQSFGIELVQQIKGLQESHVIGPKRFVNDATTGRLLNKMLYSPELRHFGRYDKVLPYENSNSDILKRDQGFLTRWKLTPNVSDDNIFAPPTNFLVGWPSIFKVLKSVTEGLAITAVGALSAGLTPISSKIEDLIDTFVYPDAENRVGLDWLIGDTADVFLSGAFKAGGLTYHLYKTTVWDVFKEMELRHPGYIALPVPYEGFAGPRMTMFFGLPDQLYFSRDETMEESALSGLLPQLEDTSRIEAAVSDLLKADAKLNLKNLKEFLGKQPDGAADYETKISTSPEYRAYKENFLKKYRRLIAGGFSDHREPQVRPFRKFHLLSSDLHIVENSISASRYDIYNAITVQYGAGDIDYDSNLNQLTFDDDPDSVTVKTDALMPDYEIQEGYIQYPNCWSEAFAFRYALGTLQRTLRDTYRGTITVMGNPDIKPTDVCFISDKYNDMYGAVEVDQVVHKFSQETGFVTELKPSLITHINESTSMGLKDPISYIAETLDIKLSNELDRKVFISKLLLGPAAAGVPASATGVLAPLVGVTLPPLAAIGGLGYLAASKYLSFSSYANPIITSPLLYHGRPMLAGIGSGDFTLKGYITRLGKMYEEGISGIHQWYSDVLRDNHKLDDILSETRG